MQQIPSEQQQLPEQKQAEDKKKLKEQLTSLFHQVQNGCCKDVSFKKYCKKNPFERATYVNFKEKMEIFKYVSVAIGQEKQDRESLICDKLPSIDAEKVEQMTVEDLW